MNYKRTDALSQSLIYVDAPSSELCHCVPLSKLHKVSEQAGQGADDPLLTLATPELNEAIRSILSKMFPRTTTLSLLMLHISELEHIHISPESAVLHNRQHFHTPYYILEQVLVNAGRTIRNSDQMLIHDGTGAAIIFPGVDQQGAYGILERVYRNISLLQAETIIPPLKRETDILMGIGSYPEPASSIEYLLYHAGLTARRFTLRPAITTQLWSIKPTHKTEEPLPLQQYRKSEQVLPHVRTGAIPHMHLPAELPTRLKHLIPYELALQLQCAPVGRDHHNLTVAMTNPADTDALRHLQEATGMTIFPVSCEADELQTLLARKW